MREIGHFIGGKEVAGSSGRAGDVFNPNTGEVQAKVAFASKAEVGAGDRQRRGGAAGLGRDQPAAARARAVQVPRAVQKEFDSLAALLSSEHGKTFADSKGDIQRGLEVVEFACGIPHLMKGEYTDSAGPGIDLFSLRQPLGVVAGITPFNFPAMIPMWKFAPAIACGNAFILKPSERDPSVPMRLAELLVEAGLPAGVLNVVNGDKEAVDALLTDPRVQAIGFVGSSAIAEYIYSTGCAHGKRVQCFGGAKNHMIVMPDADIDQAVDALIGAGYGSAGERCMAISVAVPVGKKTADILVEKLIPRVESLKVGPSTDPQADYGPMVTRAHLDKVKELRRSRRQGRRQAHGRRPRLQAAGLRERLLHGRLPVRRGHAGHAHLQGGDLRPGAVGGARQGLRGGAAASLRARLRQRRRHLHPRRRHRARLHQPRQVGMVGVNFAIPVPLAYHTFGGWKRSGFGDLNQHGPGRDPLLHQDQDRDLALAVRHQGRRRVRHPDDEVSARRVPGAAQHEAKRNDALQTRIVKRIVVAAVPDQRCTTRARALALHRIRDTRTKLLSVMRAVLRGGLVSLALAAPAAAQGDSPAQAAIRAALTQWMADFNAGRADKVCALFAPDLIAVYRGQPDRGYDALCDLLKRSLNDRSKTYTYDLAIKEILVEGDLAVVRLTWTLTVKAKEPPSEVTSSEPGMDIFRRQADGGWKIFRYIAYEAPP